MDFNKEISFRRKPKGENAAPAGKPKAKRELGFGRKSSGSARIVGLKIGGSQIAAATVVNNGAAELVQVARQPLAQGVVVGGELRDPEALTDALGTFFRRHSLPRRGVRLGIASNRIGVRTFDLPRVDDPAQLTNAIRFRAQEVLPIPLAEAVLDYQILAENVGGDGRRRVLLVVAYRELVDRYVAACRKAGIELAGIDLEPFALLRALTPEGTEGRQDAALVVVSIGHHRSTFAVSDGTVCQFTRVLDWGGFTLDVAIARALDMSPSEAQPVKLALSLEEDDAPADVAPEQRALVRDAVRRELQSFARELVSSLHFYQSQPGSLGIAQIVLAGGTAQLPGLTGELERLTGVPAALGDPLAHVVVGKRVKDVEGLGSLAAAIGLGIER
ncbi:MAG: type IV pilus assembly protein PilM [Actinomycetota bacterium]|nr:type IV pilus assembly protein PilM [Actinomycetota bacterium]